MKSQFDKSDYIKINIFPLINSYYEGEKNTVNIKKTHLYHLKITKVLY